MSEQKQEFTCPTCGLEYKNGAGLSGHMRLAHRKEEKSQYIAVDIVSEVLRLLEKRFDEQNEKIQILGRLIESVGNGLIQTDDRLKWCEADIKGFYRVGIEPKPFTKEHSKEAVEEEE